MKIANFSTTVAPKLQFVFLLLLYSYTAKATTYSADPNERWRDFTNMNESVLENGNASNGLSPAELIYYCAKENNINPVLLLVKLQDEQSLLQRSDDLERKLLRATGYGAADGGDNSYYYGFYPQCVGCTYQFEAYNSKGYTFQKAYETYTTGAGKYNNFRQSLYPLYARLMNQIAGKAYAEQPTSYGYFRDFRDVSIANIQTFLENCNGALKNKQLFSSGNSGTTEQATSSGVSLSDYLSNKSYGTTSHKVDYINRLYGKSYSSVPSSGSGNVGYITQDYLVRAAAYSGGGSCGSCSGYDHKGVDHASNGKAVSIYSPLPGTVYYTSSSTGRICIYNAQYGFTWIVEHCSTIDVSVGQTIVIGAYLGKSGAKGYATGVHTHTVIRAGKTKYLPCPCSSATSAQVYDPHLTLVFWPQGNSGATAPATCEKTRLKSVTQLSSNSVRLEWERIKAQTLYLCTKQSGYAWQFNKLPSDYYYKEVSATANAQHYWTVINLCDNNEYIYPNVQAFRTSNGQNCPVVTGLSYSNSGGTLKLSWDKLEGNTSKLILFTKVGSDWQYEILPADYYYRNVSSNPSKFVVVVYCSKGNYTFSAFKSIGNQKKSSVLPINIDESLESYDPIFELLEDEIDEDEALITGLGQQLAPQPFMVSPNPAKCGTELTITGLAPYAKVALATTMGNELLSLKANATGEVSFIADFKAGLYFLVVKNGVKREVEKLVID